MQNRNVARSGLNVDDDVNFRPVMKRGGALHELGGEGDGIAVHVLGRYIDPHILDEHGMDECAEGRDFGWLGPGIRLL